MYSVVLMTALAAGGAGTQEHCFGRGHGCHGGCYGYHSCYSACHGCYGGWGGCYGCAGCYGGYGGHGGYGMYSGFNAFQCHGCFGCSGWTGCYGCYGCFAPVVPVAPVVPPPPPPPKNGKEVPPKTPPVPPGQEEVSDRATLTVELPEDAKLYVDNVLMKSSSAKRVFLTPPLQPGKTYFYVLKAEMERDGQPVAVTGQVVLQPGQQIQASLTEPAATGSFVVTVNNRQ